MSIEARVMAKRLEFIQAHDGCTPRACRVSIQFAEEIREQLQAQGDFHPVDGRHSYGVMFIEDANVPEHVVMVME